MAGIEDVLERLVTDPEFRALLASEPAEALSGYMLFDEDLEVLAAALTEGAGASGAVEARTNKSTFAGLVEALSGLPAEAASGNETGVQDASSSEVAIEPITLQHEAIDLDDDSG